ncbi:demethylmenaquinone methyltransferase [Thermanaerosceptrum fracticalcis]|uniref:Demethylmenaquinone methyltransferase n=1 Tax=Thermanaerosceptrum fracticalcis TaxID=1712410 RepID=A0A7G6E2D8_THEFR|nr:demethylmenaquinone methyltransferase [Thermanaerosceptrum fracticalcis]QNB46242.1 demethylmenaquinone methyltransferase [Thermanaerosceptrum fracticalcis]
MNKHLGEQFEGKEEYVKNLFNSIAPFYDRMNMIMTWGLLKSWQRFVLNLTNLRPGDKALDVCTGTGELAFQMAEKVGPTGEVMGLDLSEEMLSIAREKLVKQYPQRKVIFMEGNALSLPFPAGEFACVTTGFAMRNVVDIPLAVREMTRVCKKGGRVICLEISQPTIPLFRQGFSLYFFHFIPLLGRLVDKGQRIFGRLPAYTWLPESLKKFPDRETLAQIFREAGLREVKYYPLSGGVVTVHVGVK